MKYFLFLLICMMSMSVHAQTREYATQEVIDAGNGLKIEVIKCRGEGAAKECDVIYYRTKRNEGRRVWVSAVEIDKQEKEGIKQRTALIQDSLAREKKSRVDSNKVSQNIKSDKAKADKAKADKAKADKAKADKANADKAKADKTKADKEQADLSKTDHPVSPTTNDPVISGERKDSVPADNKINFDFDTKTVEIKKTMDRQDPFPAPLSGNAVMNFTLNQCYQIALIKNAAVNKAKNNIKASEIDRQGAKYNLFPSVSYDLGHYFSSGKNIDPVTNTFVTENFSGGYTAIGIDVQIFSGFRKINAIKQSQFMYEASKEAMRKAQLEVLSNVTVTYARLLGLKEQIVFARSSMQTTARQLDVINEKIKVGRLTKYEGYSFNARMNTEQARLISLMNDSAVASQELKQLLNLDYKQPVNIQPLDSTTLANINSTTVDVAGFIDTIVRNHPAIKQARMDEQAAQLGLKIAKADKYPTVSLGGNIATNYNVNQENNLGAKIPLGQQLDNNVGKNVELTLHIPIFSQMQTSNRIKKENLNLTNAQLDKQEIENVVVKNTMQLISDFNSSKQKYAATLSAKENSQLSYTMYEEKYKLGQISSLEVLAAQDNLNATISQFIQAKLELFFRYQLLLLLKS